MNKPVTVYVRTKKASDDHVLKEFDGENWIAKKVIPKTAYVHTPEELLELKKKWAEEAWNECDVAGQTLMARKQYYINNLTIE